MNLALWLVLALGHTAPHFVTLTWKPSPTQDVGSYNVYKGTKDGGPYAKLVGVPANTLKVMDFGVKSGDDLFYVTTAVDVKGESPYSNQTEAKIP